MTNVYNESFVFFKVLNVLLFHASLIPINHCLDRSVHLIFWLFIFIIFIKGVFFYLRVSVVYCFPFLWHYIVLPKISFFPLINKAAYCLIIRYGVLFEVLQWKLPLGTPTNLWPCMKRMNTTLKIWLNWENEDLAQTNTNPPWVNTYKSFLGELTYVIEEHGSAMGEHRSMIEHKSAIGKHGYVIDEHKYAINEQTLQKNR
jgi:hypothetical protein